MRDDARRQASDSQKLMLREIHRLEDKVRTQEVTSGVRERELEHEIASLRAASAHAL